MSFRKWFIASICALSLCGALHAQESCHSGQVAGTYSFSSSGWVTVAPGPVVLPFVALSVVTIDQTGTGSGPGTNVVAGQVYTVNSTVRLKIAADCTLTFVVDCAVGCHWEGIGTFSRATKQIDLLTTKVGAEQYPVTSIGTLKPL